MPAISDLETPKKKERLSVVTWNVQGMSMRSGNRSKMREVAEFMKKEMWDVVMLSEVRAEEAGIVWLG